MPHALLRISPSRHYLRQHGSRLMAEYADPLLAEEQCELLIVRHCDDGAEVYDLRKYPAGKATGYCDRARIADFKAEDIAGLTDEEIKLKALAKL